MELVPLSFAWSIIVEDKWGRVSPFTKNPNPSCMEESGMFRLGLLQKVIYFKASSTSRISKSSPSSPTAASSSLRVSWPSAAKSLVGEGRTSELVAYSLLSSPAFSWLKILKSASGAVIISRNEPASPGREVKYVSSSVLKKPIDSFWTFAMSLPAPLDLLAKGRLRKRALLFLVTLSTFNLMFSSAKEKNKERS